MGRTEAVVADGKLKLNVTLVLCHRQNQKLVTLHFGSSERCVVQLSQKGLNNLRKTSCRQFYYRYSDFSGEYFPQLNSRAVPVVMAYILLYSACFLSQRFSVSNGVVHEHSKSGLHWKTMINQSVKTAMRLFAVQPCQSL